MALQEGDSVSLSVGLPLKIADFEYLKPHASITRVLSDDVAGDLDLMSDALREAVYRSVLDCIYLTNELVEVLDENGGDLEALAAYCAEKVGKPNDYQIQVGSGQTTSKKGPVKKTPFKKGPKKKVKAAKGKGPKRKKITG